MRVRGWGERVQSSTFKVGVGDALGEYLQFKVQSSTFKVDEGNARGDCSRFKVNEGGL
jgi:hypothetical protein